MIEDRELQERLMKLECVHEGSSLHISSQVYIDDGKRYTLYWVIGQDSDLASIEIEDI